MNLLQVVCAFFLPYLYIIVSACGLEYFLRKKWQFEIVIPVSILINTIIVYFGTFFFHNITIGIIGSLFFILFFIEAFVSDKERISFLKEKIFTPGFVVFSIIYVIIFFLNINRMLYGADDFNQWGQHVKDMWFLNDFYNSTKNTFNIVHPNYPPAIQLFEVMFVKIAGFYRENILFNAQQILCFSLFLPCLVKLKWQKNNILNNILKTVIISGLFMSIPLVISLTDQGTRGSADSFYTLLYVDSTIAALFYFGLFIIFLSKNENNMFVGFFILSILSTFMIITKEIALVFVVIMWIYFCWTYRKKIYSYFNNICLYKAKNKKMINRNIVIIFILFLLPIATFLSWKSVVNISGHKDQFSIKLNYIFESPKVIFGKSGTESQKCFVRGFSSFLLMSQAPIGHNKSYQNVDQCGIADESKLGSYITTNDKINLTYWQFWLVVVLIFWLIAKFLSNEKNQKKNIIELIIVTFIGFIIYVMTMYEVYLFSGFTSSEQMKLSSVDRYLGTYILSSTILMFTLIIYLISIKKKSISYMTVLFIVLWTCILSQVELVSPILSISRNNDLYQQRAAFIEKVAKSCNMKQPIIALVSNGLDGSMMSYAIRSSNISYMQISSKTFDYLKNKKIGCLAIYGNNEGVLYNDPILDDYFINKTKNLYIKNKN